MLPSRLPFAPALLALWTASACAPTDAAPVQPETTPEPVTTPIAPPTEETPPPQAATVSIASVQMMEDCPHQDAHDLPALPATTDASASEPVHRSAKPTAAGRGGTNIDSCTQSTMQLSFQSTGDAAAQVRINAVRLIRPDTGASVGPVGVRLPKQWIDDSGYRPWDQAIPAGSTLKASYKLTPPDWAAVEKDIGRSSYGYMFTLEVDVEIDGVVQTVSSPQFPHEPPHVVVT